MAFYFVQFLTGLASAASLFLVASGLSIIFGVTRIVNFAHGAFYMLGAYVAFTLTERFSGVLGFWGGILVAAMFVAVVGVLVEMVLLRRIYHAPELFQHCLAKRVDGRSILYIRCLTHAPPAHCFESTA